MNVPGWSALNAAAIYAVTLIAASIGAFLIAPLGLVVPGGAIWVLAIAFGALVGALSATWITNLLAEDGTRANLVHIVAMSLLVGVVLGAGFLLLAGVGVIFNLAVTLLLVLAVTAWIISEIAMRYRSAERSVKWDVVLTVLLLVLGIGSVAGSIVTICAVERCGA